MCAQNLLNDYGDDARVVIIDAEANFDLSRASKTFGLNPGNDEIETLIRDPRVFLFYNSVTEDAFDTAIEFIEQAKKDQTPTIIIIDSIATLKPKAEVDEYNKFLETGKAEKKYSAGRICSLL